MKKRLAKVILATAMVATLFISGGNAAKAGFFDEEMNQFCKLKGCTEDDVLYNDALFEEFDRWAFSINHPELDYDETLAVALQEFEAMYGPLGAESNNIYATVTDLHKDMLKKVNADRKNNGAGSLVWDADLEAVAQQRAVEVMSNVQTVEFKQAYDSGDTAKIDEIVHTGYILKENAIVSFSTGISSKKANDNWIASKGHHTQRIKADWKKYACASYTDPITGIEVWVEVFSDGTPISAKSSFDHMRYAKENPDVAAAFGQNKDALYNHYIAYGATEGRKAYNTDGSAIGM